MVAAPAAAAQALTCGVVPLPVAVNPHMAGVLELPRGRGAVKVGPGSVVGSCGAPNVSGNCSGNDGADCKCVADDITRAIVGWRVDAL